MTSQFYNVGANRQPVINYIQNEVDPSFDPLALALKKTPFIGEKLFLAACDRVYFDGYYGPVSPEDWKETDGRKPYRVKDAIRVIAAVLANIDDVWEITYCDEFKMMAEEDEAYADWDSCEDCKGHKTDLAASAEDIRAEIVYWYSEIYGVRYPQL
jgi:hypothetical protein